jgi:dissimilatory sulfite reductase (desulfoviridin) alpha/beta subunit
MSENKNASGVSITVLLPAGRLPLDMMQAAHDLARQYEFEIYLSLAQNMRLINVPESAVAPVKETLTALGADFKGPGKFPIPRICVGKPHCNLGLVDTEELSRKILEQFSGREKTKAKFKISITACPIGCAWTKNTDISVMANRVGYNVYVGGKGGPIPRVGIRIKTKATEEEVLETIETLVDFHDLKTKSKQRMYKLLKETDFPFTAV